MCCGRSGALVGKARPCARWSRKSPSPRGTLQPRWASRCWMSWSAQDEVAAYVEAFADRVDGAGRRLVRPSAPPNAPRHRQNVTAEPASGQRAAQTVPADLLARAPGAVEGRRRRPELRRHVHGQQGGIDAAPPPQPRFVVFRAAVGLLRALSGEGSANQCAPTPLPRRGRSALCVHKLEPPGVSRGAHSCSELARLKGFEPLAF